MGISGHQGLGTERKKGSGCGYKRLVRALGGKDRVLGLEGINVNTLL